MEINRARYSSFSRITLLLIFSVKNRGYRILELLLGIFYIAIKLKCVYYNIDLSCG